MTIKRVERVYRLKIKLMDIEPLIWREFAVKSYMRLDRLHLAIQTVLGWTNSHLHLFNAGGGRQYTYPYPGYDMDNDVQDETMFKLSDLINKEKNKFTYEYDFGDGWDHMVKLVAIEEADKNVKYPVCLAGERACPPEDCGGPWSYPELLETLRGPGNQERRELIDWLGDDFDPEFFDLETTNERLKRI